MSDNAQPERPSSVGAVLMIVAAVCEIVAAFCMSSSKPNLFLFAIMFTAAVVLTAVAMYSGHEYLQISRAYKKSLGRAAAQPPVA